MASIKDAQHKNESTSKEVLFRFWNDVFRKRNVMRTTCVMTASPCDVPFGRGKEHIASLCAIGAIHHCERSEQRHLPAKANITLYKQSFL
jgi:hypothetical protein